METVMSDFDEVLQRLEKIEESVTALLRMRTVKDWYTTEEAARLLEKAEFTVRAWCRNKRIQAQKRKSGRGKYSAWVISHDEILRYQREGLLDG